MPTQSSNQRTGTQAEAFVAKAVADMGFLWHGRHLDFGIDGEIEIVDRDDKVTGALVLAQVKGTRGRFPGETADVFHISVRADHIEYWTASNVPVVIVCVNTTRQEAWWKRADTWFADPKKRAQRVIEFDKELDQFNGAAAFRLAAVATPEEKPLPLLHGDELLVSNLLEVDHSAPIIHSAPTDCQDRGEAWERMRENESFEGGFNLLGGRIYSFCPLDSGPLSVLRTGPVEPIEVGRWAGSDEADVRRGFVALLNFTLRAIHHEELAWHHKKRIVYVPATDDLTTKKIKGRAPKSRGRAFFTAYTARDDVNKVRYCKHYAADLAFRRWDGQWFLEINPTYHYTIDGIRESLFEGEYLAGIKRLERNRAVLDLVRAWADFLKGREQGTLLRPSDDRIVFRELATVRIDARIDESVWIVAAQDSDDESPDGALELGA